MIVDLKVHVEIVQYKGCQGSYLVVSLQMFLWCSGPQTVGPFTDQGWMPFPRMMDLQKLLHAVPVDSLTGRVVHSYGKHQGPIEGALAEAFGFTEEARRVMRFGELERIFRAVEMQERELLSLFLEFLIVAYALVI